MWIKNIPPHSECIVIFEDTEPIQITPLYRMDITHITNRNLRAKKTHIDMEPRRVALAPQHCAQVGRLGELLVVSTATRG